MKGGSGCAWGERNSFWEAEKSCWSEFFEDWEKKAAVKAAVLGRICSLCAKVGQSEAKEGQ